MLCCIGDLVEDVVVWLDAKPAYGTDTPARIFRRRGGSAATVAARVAGSGKPARFVGQVGDDPLGAQLVAELEGLGVDVRVDRVGTTGSIVVLVDASGERTMLPDRAAATQLASLPQHALADITWLHVPVYSLVVEPLGTTSRKAIASARATGAAVSIDASSIGPIRAFGVSRLIAMLRSLRPDVFFANAEEARLLEVGPASPLPETGLTVIKAGADPVALVTESGATTMVPVVAVPAVSDTTGAGDAFAAGFIMATMAGDTPGAAAEAGSRLAATVLTQPGAGS